MCFVLTKNACSLPLVKALVAELVDAIDSKSIIFQVWEFESPRGHHFKQTMISNPVFNISSKWSHYEQ